MNIPETLRLRQSKDLARKVARYVGNDRARFRELMQLIFENDMVIAPRASWAMNDCVEAYPELIKPYFGKLIRHLERTDTHEGVTRNIVRILQFIDVPEKHLGKLTDNCFALLLHSGSPIAVKAFSMTVLLRICKREPELKNELKAAVEAVLENASAGVKNRGLKTLAALRKI
jgi:hypothetical protein